MATRSLGARSPGPAAITPSTRCRRGGIVYPVTPGTDTVTASVSQPGGTVSGSAVITVTQVPVASVVVYPTPKQYLRNGARHTVQLQDSTKDASGNNLTGRPSPGRRPAGDLPP